jgi:hypothetical protein
MKKRLTLGLLAGGLIAAMLPGLASAEGSPIFNVRMSCDAGSREAEGPMPYAIQYVRDYFNASIADSCTNGTTRVEVDLLREDDF